MQDTLRKYNLEMLSGKVITECTCIATGSDKDEHPKKWEPIHWWIEDKPKNAIAGLEAGHKPIQLHTYNKDFEHEGVPEPIHGRIYLILHFIR